MRFNVGWLLVCGVLFSFGAAECQAAPFTNVAEFTAATTGLTTDDFEWAPWAEGNYAAAVSSLGVTWSAVGTLRATTFMPHSGMLSLSDLDPNAGPDTLDELVAVLPAGVTAAGMWLRSTVGFVPVDVTAYDAANVAMAPFSLSLLDSHVFFGFTSDTPIGRLRIRAQRLPDDFLLDDFMFGSAIASVPEPASMSLIGVALLGLAHRSQKRRQRR